MTIKATYPVTVELDIDATGTTNVSSELNAFLNGLPEGAVVEFPADGKFRCNQTIRLFQKNNLVINGNGALIFTDDPTGDGSPLTAPSKWARIRSHLLIEECSNITVTGLVIRGANPKAGIGKEAYVPALEGQHGYDITRSTDVTLLDCTITDNYGDFLYLGKRSERVLVERLTGIRNGRQGVAITDANDIVLRDCLIDQVRRTGIDFEPNVAANWIDNVLIEGCTFGDVYLTWISCGSDGPVHNVTIRNNVANTPANVIVAFRTVRRQNWTLEGNRSTKNVGNPQGAAWKFYSVDGVHVHNNDIMLQSGRNMHVVGVRDCTDVDVSGNTYPGGVGELIQF